MIEKLPPDVCMKILCLLDQQNLASAQLVCRKWRSLASENTLWFNLFIMRWGEDSAALHAPDESKSWKDVYVVHDRCERVGLGLKIIREGVYYFLVDQGEIQLHLGRRPEGGETNHPTSFSEKFGFGSSDEPFAGNLDKILFFMGDLETASLRAKRSRTL